MLDLLVIKSVVLFFALLITMLGTMNGIGRLVEALNNAISGEYWSFNLKATVFWLGVAFLLWTVFYYLENIG